MALWWGIESGAGPPHSKTLARLTWPPVGFMVLEQVQKEQETPLGHPPTNHINPAGVEPNADRTRDIILPPARCCVMQLVAGQRQPVTFPKFPTPSLELFHRLIHHGKELAHARLGLIAHV